MECFLRTNGVMDAVESKALGFSVTVICLARSLSTTCTLYSFSESWSIDWHFPLHVGWGKRVHATASGNTLHSKFLWEPWSMTQTTLWSSVDNLLPTLKFSLIWTWQILIAMRRQICPTGIIFIMCLQRFNSLVRMETRKTCGFSGLYDCRRQILSDMKTGTNFESTRSFLTFSRRHLNL